jgi:NAD(P)H-nitrite reductase large subunit
MWRQIDAVSSSLLRQAMKKMHIDCYEGVNVTEIEGEGKPTGVRLADGRVFPADVVVMSCGVKANTQIAVAAGVKADRAIPVDMFMRTNVPDIYACGDCCWYDGVNYQLMAEASAQGRVAGAHAAGDPNVYFANRLIGMHVEGIGATMFAIGDAGKNEKLKYKTVETQDTVRNRHETYWFSGGALKGAVVINADEKMQDVISKVETAVRYDELF